MDWSLENEIVQKEASVAKDSHLICVPVVPQHTKISTSLQKRQQRHQLRHWHAATALSSGNISVQHWLSELVVSISIQQQRSAWALYVSIHLIQCMRSDCYYLGSGRAKNESTQTPFRFFPVSEL